MGYVAVKGGSDAILNSRLLSEYQRISGSSPLLKIETIQDQLKYLVDRVMSEGGIYAPYQAALAIKQAQGDTLEASFYLRAYRSTLSRIGETLTIDTGKMRVRRRISSAFKDIPGGQILGATPDYSQRLLDFALALEDENAAAKIKAGFLNHHSTEGNTEEKTKVIEILRREGLAEQIESDEKKPFDITMESVAFPAPRSARLQMMARSETGGILALAYSSMRGYGSIHPTIAEIRYGSVPVRIRHPYHPDRSIHIGEIDLTEAEIVASFKKNDHDGKPVFSLGYGACFGSNEVKAISMAVLDKTIQSENPKSPAEDQEFVLMHIDGIESSGFCSHFKLPHYITFQSDLDRVRQSQKVHDQPEYAEEIDV